MYTEQLSQALSIPAGQVNPQTLNSGATASANTGAVDMSKFKRALFIVGIGSVTAGGSITAKLQSCATVGGTYADVANGALNALSVSNKTATLEISAATTPNQFVRCILTETGGHDVVCACEVVAGEAEQKPANQNDSTSVVQRLVV
jgi:hypothetical protein